MGGRSPGNIGHLSRSQNSRLQATGRKADFKHSPEGSAHQNQASANCEFFPGAVRSFLEVWGAQNRLMAGGKRESLTWRGQSVLVLGGMVRDRLQHDPHGEGEHRREEAIEDEVEKEDKG